VEVEVVVIIPLMVPKMEEQVQILVVDLVVVEEVDKTPLEEDMVLLVVLMDIMVVMDLLIVVSNAVEAAVELEAVDTLVEIVEPLEMVEPNLQILSQVHQ